MTAGARQEDDSDRTRREGDGDDGTRREGDGGDRTRREGDGDDRTRREGDADDHTRREGNDDRTRREGTADAEADFVAVRLPPSLEARYRLDGPASRALEAEGGQGHIVVAADRDTGEQVVIKIYKRGTTLDQRAFDLLLEMGRDEEGRRHAVPVLRSGTELGHLWEVQEYFPLGSLERVLRAEAPMPPRFVTDLVGELAGALRYLHTRNLTHRDLKPANILLRRRQPLDLVVGDFGLATQLAVSEDVKSLAGSWPYLPPESRGNTVSPAMDWWAFGVITARALTGRHMFQEPGGDRLLPDAQISHQLYERIYTLPKTGDKRWDLLIRGLLTHDRHHRWSGDQVSLWLAGGTPPVHTDEPRRPEKAALQPFAFGGDDYTDPVALAAGFRSKWQAAGQLLVGRGAGDLRVWLRRTAVGSAADTVLNGRISDPESASVRLQVIMDPATPPQFRSRELSQDGLTAVIAAANRDDSQALEWITALRQSRILSAWAGEANVAAEIRHTDGRLSAWWQEAEPVLQQAPAEVGTQARRALEPMLLTAALSAEGRRKLTDDGRAAARQAEQVPGWLLPVRDAARLASADPGQGALAVLLLPAASRAEKARLAAQQRADQERSRRERDAEQQRRRAAAAATAQAGARRRRAFDERITSLSITMIVTVLLPWLLGRFGLRGHLIWQSEGVFEPAIRSGQTYFLSDWLSGCSVVLVVAGVLILLGPYWRYRIRNLVVAAIMIGVAGAWSGPVSLNKWQAQEAAAVVTLNQTVYPFGTRYHTCDPGATIWLGRAGSRYPVSIFSATTKTVQNPQSAPEDDCNQVDVFRGWCELGSMRLHPGDVIVHTGGEKPYPLSVNKAKSLSDVVFKARVERSGKSSTYTLAITDFAVDRRCTAPSS